MHAGKSTRMRPCRHLMLSTAGRRAMNVSTIEYRHCSNVITIAVQSTWERRFQSCTVKYDVECTKLLAVHGTRKIPSAEK